MQSVNSFKHTLLLLPLKLLNALNNMSWIRSNQEPTSHCLKESNSYTIHGAGLAATLQLYISPVMVVARARLNIYCRSAHLLYMTCSLASSNLKRASHLILTIRTSQIFGHSFLDTARGLNPIVQKHPLPLQE